MSYIKTHTFRVPFFHDLLDMEVEYDFEPAEKVIDGWLVPMAWVYSVTLLGVPLKVSDATARTIEAMVLEYETGRAQRS